MLSQTTTERESVIHCISVCQSAGSRVTTWRERRSRTSAAGRRGEGADGGMGASFAGAHWARPMHPSATEVHHDHRLRHAFYADVR